MVVVWYVQKNSRSHVCAMILLVMYFLFKWNSGYVNTLIFRVGTVIENLIVKLGKKRKYYLGFVRCILLLRLQNGLFKCKIEMVELKSYFTPRLFNYQNPFKIQLSFFDYSSVPES